MTIAWFRSSVCRRTRDRLLDELSASAPGTTRADSTGQPTRKSPPALPADALDHIERCASCRSLAAALPAVTRWSPRWAAPAPPAGLASETAARLLPFWPVRERAVNRQEIRMIWSSGLALAAMSAVAFLSVLDGFLPGVGASNAPAGDHHPLVQVGLLVGATQLVGGGLLSLVLLVLDTRRRSREAAAADRSVEPAASSATGGGEGETR